MFPFEMLPLDQLQRRFGLRGIEITDELYEVLLEYSQKAHEGAPPPAKPIVDLLCHTEEKWRGICDVLRNDDNICIVIGGDGIEFARGRKSNR
ncbi:hypothetical protein KW783_01755 [Candidatus Parcubacteria bacterium]|nr:hypothetical protein [Candidatus Parcubacteria bacterium]